MATAAKEHGYTDIYRQSLITLTEMQKLMGKKQFEEILGGLVIKPPGKPTLVPLSDKRQAGSIGRISSISSSISKGGSLNSSSAIRSFSAAHIIDMKYGLGVLVDAEENSQLKCYGIAALSTYESLYDIKEVSLSIFQPRRENVQTWTVSVEELKSVPYAPGT